VQPEDDDEHVTIVKPSDEEVFYRSYSSSSNPITKRTDKVLEE